MVEINIIVMLVVAVAGTIFAEMEIKDLFNSSIEPEYMTIEELTLLTKLRSRKPGRF